VRVRGSAWLATNDETVEQLLGRGCYLVHRRSEGLGVGGRGRTHPGDLADVLQGGGFDIGRTGLLGVRRPQGLDASTHDVTVRRRPTMAWAVRDRIR
jgi:hypothetical protein